MSLINPSLEVVYCSNLASNYSLIRFIRFVSLFTDSSRNAFFISSRFKSPYRCRKKKFGFWNFVTKHVPSPFCLPPPPSSERATAVMPTWLAVHPPSLPLSLTSSSSSSLWPNPCTNPCILPFGGTNPCTGPAAFAHSFNFFFWAPGAHIAIACC